MNLETTFARHAEPVDLSDDAEEAAARKRKRLMIIGGIVAALLLIGYIAYKAMGGGWVDQAALLAPAPMSAASGTAPRL